MEKDPADAIARTQKSLLLRIPIRVYILLKK